MPAATMPAAKTRGHLFIIVSKVSKGRSKWTQTAKLLRKFSTNMDP